MCVVLLVLLTSSFSCFSAEENWPPEGANLDDDPSKWPGNLQYIGTKFPRKEVDIFKGFPSVDDFLNEYVIPSRSVLFKGGASKLITFPSFDDGFLSSVPYSYTTLVEVRSKDNNEIATNMTVRRFLKNYKDENLYLDTAIPVLIKSQISLPRSFKCESLVKEFKTSNLLFRNGEWHDPLRSKEENSVFCQLEGKTDFRLINYAIFPKRKLVLDVNNGTESAVDVRKVDYTKYPALREVSHYYRVALDRGDCLFLPSKWLYQTSINDRSISVSISWNRKLIIPSKKVCGNVGDKNMAEFNFPGDKQTDFMSFFLLGNLHSFVEDFLPRDNTKLSYEEFERKLRKDGDLKELVNWNEECTERAREFFNQMDMNQDSVISPEDIDEISIEDLQHISGVLRDRWEDFKDIVADQKEEKRSKSSFNDIKKSFREDYEKEIQEILENSFNEIFQETNVPGKLSFSKIGEPIIDIKKKTNADEGKAKKEEEIEEIIAEDEEDEEMRKLKELENKINESKRKKKERYVVNNNNNKQKDEL